MTNGQSIVIKGDISGSEDIVIAGRIEGNVTLEGHVLTLAAGSQLVGKVLAGTVLVSGTVDGAIEAVYRLEILSTAVVKGEMNTPRLVVTEGSQVSARVDMPARAERTPRLAVAV